MDPIIQRLVADPPYSGAVVHNPQSPYFNSGVLLIDTAAWARERITEQALALLQRHATTCRFRDQTVLNHLLEGRWLQLDQRWNTISRELEWYQDRGLMPDPPPAVLHYFDTAKPWLASLQPQLAHRLWHRQARRMGGLPFILQLPRLTQRQLLKQRLQEAWSRPGRRRRRAMTQLLRCS
jgi:lipopolysaccharide biosynthesis glycosyltransferase